MRRVIRTFVMIGMVLLMVQPTFAASEYTMPDGYYSENVTLNSMGLDGKYFTYLDLAVSEWNSAKIGYSQIYRDKYVKKNNNRDATGRAKLYPIFNICRCVFGSLHTNG